MKPRPYLQIPGPTNIPETVLNELSKPPINHRGKEFEELLEKCLKDLKEVFKTRNDVLLFPSSGSGVLESAVVNLFSPDDKVITSCIGVFSERMNTICEKFGLKAIKIKKVWGEAITPDDIEKILLEDVDKEIKGVFIPHNETTTGVTCDIDGISKVIKKLSHPALLIVDAISSLGCLPLETDMWDIDVVISASQKGLMLPPGLGVVSLNDKAWAMYESSTLTKWYWDYKMVKEKLLSFQMPYTPPTNLLFGLKKSLSLLLEEELENVWNRHRLMASSARAAIKALGLELLANEDISSDTVTAVLLPESISYSRLSSVLKEQYNITVGGGLSNLQGKIFRIGHMGSIHHLDICAIISGLEMALYELGHEFELGAGVREVQKTFLKIY